MKCLQISEVTVLFEIIYLLEIKANHVYVHQNTSGSLGMTIEEIVIVQIKKKTFNHRLLERRMTSSM